MGRLFQLYLLWWTAACHRLRHDLARELTFAVATAVLLATFSYVFNDFLNVQVASLSEPMHARFAAIAATFVLLCTTAAAASWLRLERYGAAGVRQMASQLGEDRATLKAWSWLHALTILGLSHALGWWVVRRWLVAWPGPTCLVIEVLLTAATAVLVFLPRREAVPGADRPLSGAVSIGRTLFDWRLQQIIKRSRPGQGCLALGVGFALLTALATARALPLFVPAAFALAAGYCAAAALVLQLQSDLLSVWTERGAGVSHEQMVRTYSWLGAAFGLAAAVVCTLAYILAAAASPLDLGGLGGERLLAAVKIAAVSATSGLILPSLLFQIDARRSGTNLLVLFIASLFIGTAVFANLLALVLIPLLSSFALKAQAGRFYRA